MNSPLPSAPSPAALEPWPTAARLVARWLDRHERMDALLDTLPRTLVGAERARCQHLVLGVIRHFGRIDRALGRLISHAPRFQTRAVLLVAGFELIEAAQDADDGRVARIVHHAVERAKSLASPAEARLVNAVVRRLAPLLAQPAPTLNVDAAELGEYFSHPDWLVRSWLAQFGPEGTRALLEWNQRPAPIYARWRATSTPPPAPLQASRWPGFFEIPSGQWAAVEPLLKSGALYLQDPATRLPVELLDPKPGESLLDLCAAPGGKSLLLADHVAAKVPAGTTTSSPAAGRLVAVDLPGARLDRLKENLARATGLDVALVQADLLEPIGPIFREHQLPELYDAVLLDVPCSNTGVMRHRVDVKWRLQPGDFRKHPAQQLSLLHAAARLVRPGGRLAYSTCSIDSEENEHVVRRFLAGKAGGPFQLVRTEISLPWVAGHDGGGAFLLEKSS
ncbi:MAG: RsmB/NOP family class I SAM-dependent RNA methyltransferase [Verrucomicrobia bacterium]|nr:RsmB/NOP family class I SAM-dependent RNA methyltransferase [Verrucomicrobiota bacterium]